ncbi:MAG TPA: type II toxin-antitoxin system RelE/ParE family toxin [Candidatus Nitrosotalea sp.]|nr:type II toxin-antitoxin system RelE/ParE family toxin [Candidatus Nitrosotalea sp.]
MKIQYSHEARDDLRQIRAYYAERAGPEVAIQLVDGICETFEMLIRRHPTAGRRRPELGLEIRSVPIIPYVVFYGVDAGRVHVIRILHGHRDIRPPLASLLLAV